MNSLTDANVIFQKTKFSAKNYNKTYEPVHGRFPHASYLRAR